MIGLSLVRSRHDVIIVSEVWYFLRSPLFLVNLILQLLTAGIYVDTLS